MAASANAPTPSIIDSHIHLYAASHISSLAWTKDLPPSHPLNRQNSVNEYSAASACAPGLRGFIFVETDRISGLGPVEWSYALEEVSFLARICNNRPLAGEGYGEIDGKFVLGIVPWAPVPAGPEQLEQYMELVKQRCGSDEVAMAKVKGVRYLLQDKPAGTMLQPEFIAALRWLGHHNLTYDVGVDARSVGEHQLREVCKMLLLFYEKTDTKLKFIINHLCKPNLPPDSASGSDHFKRWARSVVQISTFPRTYMKLSGLFSEMPPQMPGQPAPIKDLVNHVTPWVDVIFSAFGPDRIMFGSDWPVCNLNGPGPDLSWKHWHDVVEALLDSLQLSEEAKATVWGGTAAKVYGVQPWP